MSAAAAVAFDPNTPGAQALLVERAFSGARLACGAPPAKEPAAYPRQVRVLAAVALFRANLMTARAAARECAVGTSVSLAPSQIGKANVSETQIAALVEYLAGRGPAAAASPARARPAAPSPPKGPRAAKKRVDKPHTRTLRRFASADVDPDQAMDLSPDHHALTVGRTIFPGSVVGMMESPRFLVSGHNNPKLGKAVTKGPRAGWPIFQVTLEERATCPRSCPVWAGCYGNAMPYARRHDVGEAGFMAALRSEVLTVARQYPGGLLVRLHTLGDFYSVAYVLMWAELLAQLPQLHVFGYTARRVDDQDPETRKIAQAIALLTGAMWDRFAIRTSHADFGPQRSVVVMADPELPDVIICPAQRETSEACATCGLCWAVAARGKTIAFLKHGMKRGGRGRKAADEDDTDGSGPKKEGRGNCQPRAEGTESGPSLGSPRTMRQVYSPSPPSAPAQPPKSRAPARVLQPSRTTRLKAISDDIIRWCAAYVARGVRLDYLADLFDVDAEDLAARVPA